MYCESICDVCLLFICILLVFVIVYMLFILICLNVVLSVCVCHKNFVTKINKIISSIYRGFPLTSLITLAMPRCAMLGGRLDWVAVIYLLTCIIFHSFAHILHT